MSFILIHVIIIHNSRVGFQLSISNHPFISISIHFLLGFVHPGLNDSDVTPLVNMWMKGRSEFFADALKNALPQIPGGLEKLGTCTSNNLVTLS